MSAASILHLVYIPFTGVGIRGFRGQPWLERRIAIFKEYTFKSLQNQTATSFILWLSFRPEEEFNPAVLELKDYISNSGMHAVFTFDGLMYWDDKFSRGLRNRFMNAARVVRQAWREKSWALLSDLKYMWNDKNKTLYNRLQSSLSHLSSVPGFLSVDFVYVTRLDSDDMLHKDAIAGIQHNGPFRGALVYNKGYVYNSNTGEVAQWLPKTNPPFHTIIFPKEDFFNAARYLQYFRGFRSHEDVLRFFPTIPLQDYHYCVVIHDSHISTLWNHPFRGEAVDSAVLKDFHVQN